MEAGFISASTYRALKPKDKFHELTYSECSNYEVEITEELKSLFESDSIYHSIAMLEFLDNSFHDKRGEYLELLDLCLACEQEKTREAIQSIGKEAFILECVYCKEHCLSSYYWITAQNQKDIIAFRGTYQKALEDKYDCSSAEVKERIHANLVQKYEFQTEESSISMVNDSFGHYNVEAGHGFTYKENIIIDDDALDSANNGYRKYVLYLYSLNFEQFEKYRDFLLSEITECSVRFKNAINSLGVRTFYVNYLFASDAKLFQIRNFGRKCLYELAAIRQNIIEYVVNNYIQDNPSSIEAEIHKDLEIKAIANLPLCEKIGPNEYSLLINKFNTLVENASVRTRNGIQNYAGDFIEDFVNKTKDVRSIRRIGRKTEIELNNIIHQLRETVDSLSNNSISKEDLVWIEKSSDYGNLADHFCHDFFKNHARLPMFYMLENCILSFVNERNYSIFNKVIPLFDNTPKKSLDEVSEESNLTRERVRQICIKALKELCELSIKDNDEKLLPYKQIIEQKEDWAYVLEELETKQMWGPEELKDIYKYELSSLSPYFVLMVLTLIFRDEFAWIGNDSVALPTQKSQWMNTYLVPQKHKEAFDFDMILQLVKDYEENNTESITLTVEELLMDTFYAAWKEYDFLVLEEIKPTVIHILINELGLIPDIDYRFTIEGKKDVSPQDVLYEIIKENGEPIDIEDLFIAIDERFPYRFKSSTSLRQIINKDPRVCSMGSNNKVTLTEWTHIQVGNIRDLTAGFLAQFDEPQHIKDITKYVLQFRDTNERSIASTISSGEQFEKFGNGFFGLKDKSYSSWKRITDAEKFARRRIGDLEDFLQKNQRFPFYPSDDSDEEKLCQWWNRISRQNDFTASFQEIMKKLEAKYADYPRNKSDLKWISSYQQYTAFIEEYGRKPTDRISKEKDLARWFSKNLNDISEGKLSSNKESLFIKLCQSL